MDNENQQMFRGKVGFFAGVLWCLAVIGAYHWLNAPYYKEKLSVFTVYLKGTL